MESKLLNEDHEKTFAVIFQTDDEAMSGLTQFVTEQQIHAAQFTAIGAFHDATLAYFDWSTKKYKHIPIHEQVEVLSLVGDVALDDGKPKIHAHCVVGLSDGTTRGGHLIEAHVRPTLEVIMVESPAYLQRTYDKESGLTLINV